MNTLKMMTSLFKVFLSLLGLPLVAQLVKNMPAMQETWVRSLGWKDPPEEGKANYSSILAWRYGQRSLADYSPWGHKEVDSDSAWQSSQMLS